MKVAISFLGGVVGDLTKSSILVSVNRSGYETNILVDCGLWQGSKSRFYERNMELDVDPTTLDAVLITHAHVDHLGRLPVLHNNGLGHDGKEKVFCTKPTFSLVRIMLLDTANIAERESLRRIHKEEEINRKTVKDIRKTFKNNGRKEVLDRFNIGWAIKPYSILEAEESMKLFKGNGYSYGEWFKIAKKVEAKFYPSGHVLGGAIIVLRIKGDNFDERSVTIGFSGDLGRKDGIILPPPKIIEESLDYWVTESTYGGIIHPDRLVEVEKIKSLVRECGEKKGKLFIPSFALERAQEIIYLLSYFMFKKDIPRLPIFLDSPMATDILDVFSANWKTQLFKDQYKLNFNPFNAHSNKFLKISRTFEQSEGLISGRGPYIIIAGSGMGDAGRIRGHYKKGLASNRNIVAMIGYAVSGTLNRAIIDGQKRIKIDGKYYSVKAKIEKFGSFSAHADKNFLTEYTEEVCNKSPNLKGIFINHGGENNGIAMQRNLVELLGDEWEDKIVIPRLYDQFVLF